MIISKRNDLTGRTRYYVLPLETREGFDDLMKFISQEFSCEFGLVDEGPGTVVQRALVEGAAMVFVLSDSTGTQFYPEVSDSYSIAERIANSIEKRIRAVMAGG